MSKLIVDVTTIKSIEEHPNANRLDIATVKGWRSIVPKGEFAKGELVIYVPPDSVLPSDFIKRFDVGYLKNKHGRVGTVKLRGEYSEGIVLKNMDNLPRGTNAAEYYRIVKWEPSVSEHRKGIARPHRKHVKGFLRYTGIENIKNYPDVLEPGTSVVITEKIHGTNFRAGWVPRYTRGLVKYLDKLLNRHYDFVVGSRRVAVSTRSKKHDFYGTNVYAAMARQYELKERIPKGFVVYGEIYGLGIQDLTYGLNGIDIAFFDIMNTDTEKYLGYGLASKLFNDWGLPTVPLLYSGFWTTDLLEQHSTGMSALDNDTLREGCVIRPIWESHNSRVGRVILKVISQEYLTRKKGTEWH